MVNYSEQQLDAAFHALGNATRRAILTRLTSGECSVGELAAPFAMSLPAISKHLRVLEQAGFVERHKEGRVRRMSLNAEPMRELNEFTDRYRDFWEQRLEAMAEFLERPPDSHEEKQP